MKQLKGVAVGAGYFSQFHFEAWSRNPAVELAAVCDLNREAGRQVADKYKCRYYGDFEQMLDTEQPDFVDIITRPDSHLALTESAIGRGVAVICQKPLAPSYEEACRLVQVVGAHNVPFMVHENFRFQPWYRELKRLLDQGVLGERLHSVAIRTRTGDGWQADAYLARQPYFRTMPRFLVFEMGVHFLDTLRYLGGEIETVFAKLRRLNPDIAGEDAATVLLDFKSGAQALWDANRFNEPNCQDPRYTFVDLLMEGSGGSIRLDGDANMTIQPLGKAERKHLYSPVRKNFAGDCVYATQQHFVDCLLDHRDFETDGQSYLRTLAVQEAVYRSAAVGQPVQVTTAGEELDANN